MFNKLKLSQSGQLCCVYVVQATDSIKDMGRKSFFFE